MNNDARLESSETLGPDWMPVLTAPTPAYAAPMSLARCLYRLVFDTR